MLIGAGSRDPTGSVEPLKSNEKRAQTAVRLGASDGGREAARPRREECLWRNGR
jgi:hypothetical protein